MELVSSPQNNNMHRYIGPCFSSLRQHIFSTHCYIGNYIKWLTLLNMYERHRYVGPCFSSLGSLVPQDWRFNTIWSRGWNGQGVKIYTNYFYFLDEIFGLRGTRIHLSVFLMCSLKVISTLNSLNCQECSWETCGHGCGFRGLCL